MDFKNWLLKSILPRLILGFLLIGFLVWKFFPKADLPAIDNNGTQVSVQNIAVKENAMKEAAPNPVPIARMVSESAQGPNSEEDSAIQRQLDRDRQQQKLTKDLKNKLEQTNLELEEEKALAEINTLKKENMGAFNEPNSDGQNNLPEIIVDYIGGNSVKKEAILSIGGTTYQVKEKSNPTDNIQVVSISDTSVTLHFRAPQDLTKTIDYKPE